MIPSEPNRWDHRYFALQQAVSETVLASVFSLPNTVSASLEANEHLVYQTRRTRSYFDCMHCL